MRFHPISLVILVALAVAACAPSPSTAGQIPAMPTSGDETPEGFAQPSSPNPDDNPTQFSNTLETLDMTSTPPDKDKLINLAKQDLADRLKTDAAQIALVKTTDILWPNISIGCTPGQGQILTKGRIYGYRVWLEANGDEYIYHTGENDQVILCPRLNPGVNNPLLPITPDSNETPQSPGK